MQNFTKNVKNILDRVPIYLFILDTDGNIINVNRALTRFFEVRPQSEIDTKEIIETHISSKIRAGEDFNHSIEIECSSLKQTFVYDISKIHDDNEVLIGYLGIIRNVTEERVAEKKLNIFGELIEQAPISIVITDRNGNIEFCNDALLTVSGYSLDELIGKNPRIFKSELNADVVYAELWQTITNGDIWNGRLINKKKNDDLFIEHVIIAPLKDSSGVITNFIGFKENITDKVKLEEKLLFDEAHDILTGLLNRHEFELRLFLTLSEAIKHDKVYFVAIINIDDFRVINDVLGYDVGDELLKEFSKFMRDNIPDHIILSRLGGDEFGALFVNCTETAVISTCEFLKRQVMNWRFIWKDTPFKITVSIGISSINKESKNVSTVLTNADFACNEAKKVSKNRVQVYSKDSVAFIKRKEQLEIFLKLKNVIEQGKLFLLFQKIEPVNPVDKYHYETLIRIKEDNKLISPIAFLEVAENFQMVFDIDMWVIRNVFRLLYELKKICEIDFMLTINLSSKTISDIRCFDVIKELAEHYEIDSKTIGFELTETAAIINFDVAIELIGKLKGMGFIILLDDFGSGMSNFSRFQSLQVQVIKIDGSLIKNVAINEFDKSLVRGIVDIAKTIGAKTVAEFVHNKVTYDECKTLGIDFLQGFYVQKPLPMCSLFCQGEKVCLNGEGGLRPNNMASCPLYNEIIELTKGDQYDKKAIPVTGP